MDFTLNEEQTAIADLAQQILSEQLPPERLKQLETDPAWFSTDVWAQLAKADLLGLCVPESNGGAGFGIVEACLVAQAIGRTVAPVPYLATIVLGAMPIARFGSDALKDRYLPGVADGSIVLTAALAEAGAADTPTLITTTATRDGEGWRLDGEKHLVPAAGIADAILVPARTGDRSLGVFILSPAAPGVSLEREIAVSGEPQWLLRLDGVEVAAGDVLGDAQAGEEVVRWMVDHGTAAVCATQVGVCEAALKLTAAYVSEREQFGSKLGTFQAVAQRLADAYIDTEAIRLTSVQAAWRLSADLPAANELAIAKFWAADGAQRVVHAAQHLHGGIGVDADYPVHRYFRWAKTLELTLGGATPSLLRLGANLAAEPIDA
ncbi:MAG: 3-oxocholest-4-en-26-oyl-CoA dehydrogenase beta subunit [Nocardioidaceae bacterium]|jgi:alkylation response protein AidB-like acyl-CoA dehydrogenase|nr:3-oxocholest-4-en-26-oyl-CoA dehydrogenase beta subunit [Nocardioidaceae bacterium]